MAEALKESFKINIVASLARRISIYYPVFDSESFVEQVDVGFERLELMDRGRQVSRVLKTHLPVDYATAIKLLVATMDPPPVEFESAGMSVFRYLPISFFIADYGLNHFDDSMLAQYELTQRFTAEFSIRPFLLRYPDETLARLKQWINDPNEQVRRLVSEGTRPRLPWACRLRPFQKDPFPVLELLESLKDDESLYVRRSVANNLNDIGKDHPDILVETASRWLKNASHNRKWLVKHALRSAVKRGEMGALQVLGFGNSPRIKIKYFNYSPTNPVIGDKLRLELTLTSMDKCDQSLMIDIRAHFIKKNGKASPKVFKLKAVELSAGQSVQLSHSINLKNLSTRKHYPGTHQLDLLVNGQAFILGTFILS
ncbi:MAG: 3-methyladenine DNA glycosylase AlkC [Gammaproteobacteria bacterium]|jgi:3-methyladenine DNA glycosylase AlkC